MFISRGVYIKRSIVNDTHIIFDTTNKGSNMSQHQLINGFSTSELNQIAEVINREIANNKNISMAIATNDFNEIRFIPTDDSNVVTTNSWNEGAAHAIFVTGTSENGILVSSWGKRYVIPYEDLANNASFQITTSSISESTNGIFNKFINIFKGGSK